MTETEEEQNSEDQKRPTSQQDRLYQAYLHLFGKSETLEDVKKSNSTSATGWEKNPLF